MDFRTPRPIERTAVNRSEPTHTPPPEEPQPKKEAPVAVQRIGASPQSPKVGKSKKPIIIAIAIIALVIVGLLVWSNKSRSGDLAIDGNKYQAVFFTNGQVYFGKLQAVNDDYLKLTNIFYLQTQATEDETESKNPQKTTTEQNNVQLIKLGQEVHGPEDEMIISKDQVLFYENLKSNGKVSQSISSYKKP